MAWHAHTAAMERLSTIKPRSVLLMSRWQHSIGAWTRNVKRTGGRIELSVPQSQSQFSTPRGLKAELEIMFNWYLGLVETVISMFYPFPDVACEHNLSSSASVFTWKKQIELGGKRKRSLRWIPPPGTWKVNQTGMRNSTCDGDSGLSFVECTWVDVAE